MNDNLKEEGKEEIEEKKNEEEEVKKRREGPATKIDSIVDIVNGITPEGEKKVDVVIHNLMSGKTKLPETKTKKVLVFSNYNETLKNTEIRLIEEKIKYWRLGGTNSQIVKTIKEFTNYSEKCVLLINSIKHCSGLNLQMCSDLVFTHLIQNNNIESQVAGRGQRLGRESPLKIRYLLYENEYESLVSARRIREL